MLIETYSTVLKPSNPAYAISIAHEQTLQKSGFPHMLQAVLGLHGIVVKCTAAVFFLMEDYLPIGPLHDPVT